MKRSIKAVSVFLLTLIIILGCPIGSKAADDLTIPSWIVEANLLETGDLKIVEDITFRFNDKFNGVFREVVSDKTSGILVYLH